MQFYASLRIIKSNSLSTRTLQQMLYQGQGVEAPRSHTSVNEVASVKRREEIEKHLLLMRDWREGTLKS
jgi:hypothetical protein